MHQDLNTYLDGNGLSWAEEDGYILPIQPKNHCALSRKGMLFLDSIASILIIDN